MARPLTLPEGIYVRLPAGALATIDAEAKKHETTRQEIVRTAILAAFGILSTPKEPKA